MRERRLVLETPEMHTSHSMQSYISKEVARPCKQWIHDVLSHKREADRVKLRTNDFVLLPDVDTFHSQLQTWGNSCKAIYNSDYGAYNLSKPLKWRTRRLHPSFHWLAVVTDVRLRTLRDLRGCHVPMLTRLYVQACQTIKAETGVDPDQVMAYIHYPPSVYHLHIHFKYPLSPSVSHDAFRVHSLVTVINNLQIDSDYYSKSMLQMPVHVNTELHTALEPALSQIQIRPDKNNLLLDTECTASRGSRPSTPDQHGAAHGPGADFESNSNQTG